MYYSESSTQRTRALRSVLHQKKKKRKRKFWSRPRTFGQVQAQGLHVYYDWAKVA